MTDAFAAKAVLRFCISNLKTTLLPTAIMPIDPLKHTVNVPELLVHVDEEIAEDRLTPAMLNAVTAEDALSFVFEFSKPLMVIHCRHAKEMVLRTRFTVMVFNPQGFELEEFTLTVDHSRESMKKGVLDAAQENVNAGFQLTPST